LIPEDPPVIEAARESPSDLLGVEVNDSFNFENGIAIEWVRYAS
jgi:hypothetical protein